MLLGTNRSRRDYLAAAAGTGAAGAAATLAAQTHPTTAPAKRPNFVFVVMDDMGWVDLGCYGSKFHDTPNLDRLAGQGVRFTQAYASCPVCSPTRASLITGQYPARVGITDWIPGTASDGRPLRTPANRDALPASLTTLAESLRGAGYATGFVGKWHLGGEGSLPQDHGFESNVGGDHRGQPKSYFSPYKNPRIKDGPEGEYLTDRLTDESLAFLDKAKQHDKPFLLCLWHYAVHTPLAAKQAVIERYTAKAKDRPGGLEPVFRPEGPNAVRQNQNNPLYAGVVDAVDESMGRIMQKLRELQLDDNTVVIFTSDHGGLSTRPKVPDDPNKSAPTSNKPLRAGKGWLYEGGVRVPLIIRWTGKIKPAVTDAVSTSTDLMPTMLELAGVEMPAAQPCDGISLKPVLGATAAKLPRQAIYWHYPHYHGSGAAPAGAVRAGDYKLIEFYESGTLELYDLASDLGEEHNLAGKLPQKTAELHRLLREWRTAINAAMPQPSPQHDSRKSAPASGGD